MRNERMLRILSRSLALAAIAAALVLLGLVLTGPAAAASAQPFVTATPLATSGEVQGAIVRFGEDVTVPAGARVEDVGAFGGDVTIDGTVIGSVVAFGGDVLVRGTVEEDLVAFGGDVRLAPTAVVGGTVSQRDASIILFGGTLTRDPGAQVTGDVQRIDTVDWAAVLSWATQHTVIRPWWGFTLMGWIVQTAFFLVLALVAAALMPRQLRAVQLHLGLKPAGSLGWGALIFFIAGPAVLVVLVISIVGLLVVIPYLLFVLLAYFFVVTAVAAFVAQRVLAGGGQKDNLMLAVTLGVVGTTIVSRIPVLGPLVVVAMMIFGTGAAALAIGEWRKARKLAGAPPAGAAPVLPGAPGGALAAPGVVAPAGPAGGEAMAPVFPTESVPPVVPPVVLPVVPIDTANGSASAEPMAPVFPTESVPPVVPPVVPSVVPPVVPPVVPVESETGSASAEPAEPVTAPPADAPPADAPPAVEDPPAEA